MDQYASKRKDLFVITSDNNERDRILDAVNGEDLRITVIKPSKKEMAKLAKREADLLIVGQEAGSALEGLSTNGKEQENGIERQLPVVMFGDFDQGHDEHLERLGRHYTIRKAPSTERLLDLSSLYLHRNISKLPPACFFPFPATAFRLGLQR